MHIVLVLEVLAGIIVYLAVLRMIFPRDSGKPLFHDADDLP